MQSIAEITYINIVTQQLPTTIGRSSINFLKGCDPTIHPSVVGHRNNCLPFLASIRS